MPRLIENAKHAVDQVGDGYVVRQYLKNGLPVQSVSFTRQEARELANAVLDREAELDTPEHKVAA